MDRLILAVNCGSSSIKISLFGWGQESYRRLIDAQLKGLKTESGTLEITSSKGREKVSIPSPHSISEGLIHIFHALFAHSHFSFSSLTGIGHRFVHGGRRYSSSVLIDQTVLGELETLSELAPLHNESCLEGIKECLRSAGNIPQVAVFDTAFYRSMPEVASQYAIPNAITEKHGIRRYGFHGISHAFLWKIYADQLGKKAKEAKIITLHLGNGCSMTAISGGVPMDTSMGFTPAEGLMMGTRAGDIDVAVMEWICRHEKKTPNEVMEIFNSQSGLLGVSALSSDMEIVLNAYDTNEKAKRAVDLFCYRIVKYLGAYLAVLGGKVDALIFSGGIGENAPLIREKIVNGIEWIGIKLDREANLKAIRLPPGEMARIHAADSRLSLFVIATDENLFIGQEVQRFLAD